MAVIAVAGGMGQVGRAIVDGLLKHGHKVIVLSRKVLQELSNHRYITGIVLTSR